MPLSSESQQLSEFKGFASFLGVRSHFETFEIYLEWQPAIGIPLHIHHCLTREPNLISLPSVALGEGFVGDDSQDLLGGAAGLDKAVLALTVRHTTHRQAGGANRISHELAETFDREWLAVDRGMMTTSKAVSSTAGVLGHGWIIALQAEQDMRSEANCGRRFRTP